MDKEFWTKEQVKKLLEIVLPKPGEFAEVYLEKTGFNIITLANNKIDGIEAGYDQGLNIRAGDESISLCLSSLDFDEVLKKVKIWAKRQGFRGGKIADFDTRNLPDYSPIRIPPENIPLDKKVELLWRINETARTYDERIVQVTGNYVEQIKEVLVANSEGIFETDKRTYLRLIADSVAKKDDLIQRGFEAIGGTQGLELFEEETPEEVARESARIAILQLEARPAPAGSFTVVLHSSAGGVMVHEAVGHGLEADFIVLIISIFAGKLGQKVASELITVVDDRTLPHKRGTARIDDEGWPTQKTVLIENGVLKNFLCDRKSAKKLGLSQNGHGRRQSYRFLPIPRMGNTMIAPGKDNPQEIIESVKKGILVKGFGGGQVTPASGAFVFSITEGYLLEKGKVKEPIRGATLIGNCLEVLAEIDMVGNDLGFAQGTCGKDDQGAPVADAQPTLRIPKITVGGESR